MLPSLREAVSWLRRRSIETHPRPVHVLVRRRYDSQRPCSLVSPLAEWLARPCRLVSVRSCPDRFALLPPQVVGSLYLVGDMLRILGRVPH